MPRFPDRIGATPIARSPGSNSPPDVQFHLSRSSITNLGVLMIEVTLTLFLVALICLVFPSTRLIGVVGVVLLFLLRPLLFVGLVVFWGVAYFIYCYNRS